jgi:hypothetical protein
VAPPSPSPPEPGRATRPLAHAGWRGGAAGSLRFASPAAETAALAALLDAERWPSVHRGRNRLWRAELETSDGVRPVVVKRFGRENAWHRLRRRLFGGKAARSYAAAEALLAAGVATPEPLLWLEAADRSTGVFVAAALAGAWEARALIHAMNAGEAAVRVPALTPAAFLGAAAATARRLHDAGIWHRDFSAGNLLLVPGASPDAAPGVFLLDLNRARLGRRCSLGERMRDLARLPLARTADREVLLAAYFAPAAVPARARRTYETVKRSFEGRHQAKRALRERLARWRGRLLSRGAHPHIPAAAADAPARERAVWDALSDQPHLHAGRWEKVAIRFADGPANAAALFAAARAVPRIRRRYRELARAALATGRPWSEPGIAIRPWPREPAHLRQALAELGTRRVLLRLHPWEDGAARAAEIALAQELAADGFQLSFALPQNRDLVRSPARWAAAVEALAAELGPLAEAVQIGQAINRSKWGLWTLREVAALAGPAVAAWRRHAPSALVLGGAVIDFEPHVTAAVANLAALPRTDGLAHLLYVDRRGAPENRQLGFDALGKALLLRAMAETGRACGPASWVTEVNWPLDEGAHSPAGRLVAVDEEAQADYLVRYFLLLLAGGGADRVYWWQLFAKGYGLADPLVDGKPRRRPAFHAFAQLVRTLRGSHFRGRLAVGEPGTWALGFDTATGEELAVAWAAPGATPSLRLGSELLGVETRDGLRAESGGEAVALGPSPRYLWLAPGTLASLGAGPVSSRTDTSP